MKKLHMNDPILKFLPNRVILRKVVILPILALLIAGILWGLVTLLFLPNRVYTGGTDYILYIKNKDLYIADHQSKPAMLAANMTPAGSSGSEIYADAHTIGNRIVITDQKDRIFSRQTIMIMPLPFLTVICTRPKKAAKW